MPQSIQILQNPFDGDQFFETEILAGQQEVLTSQKNSLLLFKKTYFSQQLSSNLTTNFFMSLQENYLNTVHFITKNAIVATVLILLALTTISASAAELLAPTEYKPSTILNLKPATGKPVQPVGISSSSSSVSSSSSQTSVSSSNSNQTKLIYTNPKFPNLKIDYTGWQIEEKKIDTYDSDIYKVDLTISKNGGVTNFKLIAKNTYIEGGGIYITGYKQLSSTLARQRMRSGEWRYQQQLNPRELSPLGCVYGGEENEEYREPGDVYCGSFPSILFEDWIPDKFFGLPGKPIYEITYTGLDSLLPEVDQMVLNSGLKI